MSSIVELLNPATPVGSIVINILGGVGVAVVLAIIAWLTGPLRWWIVGRNLKQILLNGRSFNFVFNPTHGQAKTMTFLPSGEIGEGRNSNEYLWRIRHGKLEILAFDGKIYSRFVQDKKTGKLVHTNDPDTRSIHGQYIQPHFTPWQSGAEQVVPFNGEAGANLEHDFVDMTEATTRIYEQLRAHESLWTEVAERFAGSGLGKTREEGVRLYIATALTTQKVPLYGKRPPSRLYELIDPDEFKRGRFSDNGATFIRHSEKSPVYVDIAVRSDDLVNAIDIMKTDSSKAI